MKTFICIALLATAAFAAPSEKKGSNDARGKRSYLHGGYDGLSLTPYSSGWAHEPLHLAPEIHLHPAALPSARLVSYDKIVSVPKVIEIKKIVSEPRVVNEAHLVKVSRIVQEPTYTAPLHHATSTYNAGWW